MLFVIISLPVLFLSLFFFPDCTDNNLIQSYSCMVITTFVFLFTLLIINKLEKRK